MLSNQTKCTFTTATLIGWLYEAMRVNMLNNQTKVNLNLYLSDDYIKVTVI
jgi:hypothetical protein